jgi:hypothetical protein
LDDILFIVNYGVTYNIIEFTSKRKRGRDTYGTDRGTYGLELFGFIRVETYWHNNNGWGDAFYIKNKN